MRGQWIFRALDRLQALPGSSWVRIGTHVLRISAVGICFGQPHRIMPPRVYLGSVGFAATTALYFAATALRDWSVGVSVLDGCLACAMTYAVLLLVSLANRMPEMTLVLCIAAGLNLVVSTLALSGVVDAAAGTVQNLFLAWELTAVFAALYHLGRHRGTAPTDAD